MSEPETRVTTEEKEYARLLDEYKEAGVNLRHYGEVRFKQLTVFLSATAGLGAALYTGTVQSNPTARMMLVSLGLAIVAAFGVLEERATYYRRAYMAVLLDLERKLAFQQYRLTRNPLRLSSRFVYRALFALVAYSWIFLGAGMRIPDLLDGICWFVGTICTLGLANYVLERYQRGAMDILVVEVVTMSAVISPGQKPDNADNHKGENRKEPFRTNGQEAE